MRPRHYLPSTNYPSYNYDPTTHTGRLYQGYIFKDTGITGHIGAIQGATLNEDGALYLHEAFQWDFGSWPAIDTPGMVVASLAHDALCRMTDAGEIPWKYRKVSDKFFYKTLKEWNEPRWRAFYCWLAVRAYSALQGVRRAR